MTRTYINPRYKAAGELAQQAIATADKIAATVRAERERIASQKVKDVLAHSSEAERKDNEKKQ